MKAFIVCIISILFLCSIVFSCGEDTIGDDSTPSTRERVQGSNPDSNKVVCRGKDPGCSGSDCCGEDDNENQDLKCSNICRDLFRGEDFTNCVNNYSIDVITEVQNIIDNLFDRPNFEKFYENKDFDFQENPAPLCALVEISSEPWIKKVEDYSTPTYARNTLEWMVSKNIWYFFLSEGDDNLSTLKNKNKKDDLLKLVETLIGQLGRSGTGSITTAHILTGLTKKEVSDKKTVFYLTQSMDGFRFVHNEIVEAKICSETNRPVPNQTGDKRYVGGQLGNARGYGLEACILAVYCRAGSTNDYDEERKSVARLVGSEVDHFIETSVSEGGLGVEDDATEWPVMSCVRLRQYWNENSRSTVNLGLGN